MPKKVIDIPDNWPEDYDPNAAVRIIQQIGFWHLAGYSGCLCGMVEIFSIKVRVSCYKSSSRIYVSSHHMDGEGDVNGLQKVGLEVQRQCKLEGENYPIVIVLDAESA